MQLPATISNRPREDGARRRRGRPPKIKTLAPLPTHRQRLDLGARAGEAIIANWFTVGLRDLRARSRDRAHIARARHMAMLLVYRAFPLSFSRAGLLLGRDRTGIRYGLGRALSDPRLARQRSGLDLLQHALVQWTDAFVARAGSPGKGA